MHLVASNAQRVPENTSSKVNDRIRHKTSASISYYADHPDEIEQRLQELDKEWDVERCLETGASSLSLFGLVMGATRSRKWFLLPLAVQGFFLQHALQGWCPPLPLFRSLGFRTQSEIEAERYALKAIRGDFGSPATAGAAASAADLP